MVGLRFSQYHYETWEFLPVAGPFFLMLEHRTKPLRPQTAETVEILNSAFLCIFLLLFILISFMLKPSVRKEIPVSLMLNM